MAGAWRSFGPNRPTPSARPAQESEFSGKSQLLRITSQSSRPRARIRSLAAAHRGVRSRETSLVALHQTWPPVKYRRSPARGPMLLLQQASERCPKAHRGSRRVHLRQVYRAVRRHRCRGVRRTRGGAAQGGSGLGRVAPGLSLPWRATGEPHGPLSPLWATDTDPGRYRRAGSRLPVPCVLGRHPRGVGTGFQGMTLQRVNGRGHR